MFKYIKLVFLFALVLVLSFSAFQLSTNVDAIETDWGYLFFERMQVGKQTDIILMATPSHNYTGGDTELKITFQNDVGQWCLEATEMVALGVDSSAVDSGNWEITQVLPAHVGDLEASCTPGNEGEGTYDSIVIGNIGPLVADEKYGVKIFKHENFQTSSTTGEKEVVISLDDGVSSETRQLGVSLIASDSVVVSATVAEVNTITCTISTSSVSFASLPRDGSYVTREHSLAADSSHENGYYWAVFGQGNGTVAGLWKSTIPMSLIPSSGSTTIDLSKNHGFGLSASSASGTIPANFSHSNAAVFGAIDSGQSNSRLIYQSSESGMSNVSITLGARAGASAEVGPYTETLTYLCGGLY